WGDRRRADLAVVVDRLDAAVANHAALRRDGRLQAAAGGHHRRSVGRDGRRALLEELEQRRIGEGRRRQQRDEGKPQPADNCPLARNGEAHQLTLPGTSHPWRGIFLSWPAKDYSPAEQRESRHSRG